MHSRTSDGRGSVAVCDFPGLLSDLITRRLTDAGLEMAPPHAAVCTVRWVARASTPAAAATTGLSVLVTDTAATARALRRDGATAVCVRDVTVDELVTLVDDAVTGRTARGVPATPTTRDRPTDRELDVMQLLANGYRNEQIAAALGISPHTVRTHIQRVIVRLGVTSRAAAVVRLTEEGLVDSGGAFSA